MKLLLLLITSVNAFAAERVLFKKEVDGTASKVEWTVESTPAGIVLAQDDATAKTKIVCTKAYEFLAYEEQNRSEDYSLALKLDGTQLTATFSNSKRTKTDTLDLEGLPWIQNLSFGLCNFAKGYDRTFSFVIVHAKDLSLKEMVATKGELETIELTPGKSVEAQKIKVTLTGFYKGFWKAELWCDPKTGQTLRYQSNEGPRTPTTVLTLDKAPA